MRDSRVTGPLPASVASPAYEVDHFQSSSWPNGRLSPGRPRRNLTIVFDRNPVALQIQFRDNLRQRGRWAQVGKRSALAVDRDRQRHNS